MAATSSRSVVRSAASSEANGSSSSTTSGSVARARARATRWRSPPDSSWGYERDPVGEADQLQALLDPALAGLAEPDVVGHGQVGEQRAVLEHHADAAPVGLDPGAVPGDHPAADRHGAGVGHLEPGDDPEQRGLARAARAEQRHHLARGATSTVASSTARVPPNDFAMRVAEIAIGSFTWAHRSRGRGDLPRSSKAAATHDIRQP